MKYRYFIVFLFVVKIFFPFSVSSQINKFSITGNLVMDSLYADIFLEDYSSKPKIISHAAITSDGQFSIEHTITGLDFFKLKLDASNYLVMVVLPGEKIHISSKAASMAEDPLITGSPNSTLLHESFKEIGSYDRRISKLYLKYQKLKRDSVAGREIASVEAKMTNLNRQKSDFIQGFVAKLTPIRLHACFL